MRASACLAAVVAALLVPATARAQEDVAVTVTSPAGARTVTTAELEHWTDIARRAGGVIRGRERAVAFELLVSYLWIEGEAAELGLAVSDEAVMRAFVRQRRSAFPTMRAYRRFLRDTGQTAADIRLRVRLDLLSRLIRRKVMTEAERTVTDAAVDAYLAEHGNGRLPERRDVRVIRTRRRPAAVAAKRELRGGATWRSVARRYSTRVWPGLAPGALARVERANLAPALARRLFRAQPRRVVGPVRAGGGWYVFRVTRVHPARELSVARSRQLARQRLVAEAQQLALERFTAEFRAKWRSRTVCAPRFAAFEECGGG